MFDGLLEGCFTLRLESAELSHVAFAAALNAALIESEESEVIALGDPDAALGEGGIDFFVARSDRARGGDAFGEDGVFESRGALQAPAIAGDSLDQIAFGLTLGHEGFAITLAMFVESGLVSGGQNVDLAGESVP